MSDGWNISNHPVRGLNWNFYAWAVSLNKDAKMNLFWHMNTKQSYVLSRRIQLYLSPSWNFFGLIPLLGVKRYGYHGWPLDQPNPAVSSTARRFLAGLWPAKKIQGLLPYCNPLPPLRSKKIQLKLQLVKSFDCRLKKYNWNGRIRLGSRWIYPPP